MVDDAGAKTDLKGRRLLDVSQQSPRARQFSEQLNARIVGQDRAIQALAGLYQVFVAGMCPAGRPIGTMLFLGPTGSGKTRAAEAAAEVLFGDPRALIKIDCAEFQHAHEIAKLIGPPPGYVGHRESAPLFSQENLDRHQSAENRLSIVLFDEIEKASEALWQLLLGVLDRATLTLGDNKRVDFSRTIVVMTSNLGAQEMAAAASSGFGFSASALPPEKDTSHLNDRLQRAGLDAARRRFSPEFMNRLDKVVVFQSLTSEELAKILDIELKVVQDRLLSTAATKFLFECTAAVKAHLLAEGLDARYGARHLKRTIEQRLVLPLSSLAASDQVDHGDVIEVDIDDEDGELLFAKQSTGASLPMRPIPAIDPRSKNAVSALSAQDEELATRVAVATAAALTGVIMTLLAEQASPSGQ